MHRRDTLWREWHRDWLRFAERFHTSALSRILFWRSLCSFCASATFRRAAFRFLNPEMYSLHHHAVTGLGPHDVGLQGEDLGPHVNRMAPDGYKVCSLVLVCNSPGIRVSGYSGIRVFGYSGLRVFRSNFRTQYFPDRYITFSASKCFVQQQ